MANLNKKMVIFSFLLLNFLYITDPAFSQMPKQDWLIRYDSPLNRPDYVKDLVVDDSGSVYIAGSSENTLFNRDYVIKKYDRKGVLQWTTVYNGVVNIHDDPAAIAIDNQGNIYVTGGSYGVGNSGRDYLTIKINPYGNILWEARYNGPNNWSDEARAIEVDESGNVYVTGYSYGLTGLFENRADIVTIKYNTDGQVIWLERYNGPDESRDEAFDLALDGAGNVYVTGFTTDSTGAYDIVTLKYNSAGVEQWASFYNGPQNLADIGAKIAIDDSGNYIYVTGKTRFSGNPEEDFVTIKYNSTGVEQWVSIYNNHLDGPDYATDIEINNDGDIVVAGYSSSQLNWDFFILKYNPAGDTLWSARYPGGGRRIVDNVHMAIDASDNIYITGTNRLIGSPYFDIKTVKYNSDGVFQWDIGYDGAGSHNSDDFATGITVDQSGNVYVIAESMGIGSDNLDIVLIKYSQPVSSVTQSVGSPGIYNFNEPSNNTSVSIDFTTVTGSGDVSVSFFNSPPTNYSLQTEGLSNVSWYRWIIDQDGLSGIDAKVKFYIPDIPESGIYNPNSVVIYSRPVPGIGMFTPLVTNLGGEDTLIASVNGFSEFIFVSDDDPLPVSLSSFNALVDGNNVILQWTTEWEENNMRFDVQRRSVILNGGEGSLWNTLGSVTGSGTTQEQKSYSYLDRNLVTGKYEYRLIAIDVNGNETTDNNNLINIEIGIPANFELSQNYPNPFNPGTKIDFRIPVEGLVKLTVYDITGREIAILANEVVTPGYYTIDFDASNFASGVYFYRLDAKNFVVTKKMLLVK